MGLFSGIFGGGSKKTKIDRTDTSKVNASQQSQQTQTNEQTKASTTQANTSGTNQRTGTQAGSNVTQQAGTNSQQGTNQSTSQLFSSDILTSLEALAGGGAGGVQLGLDQLGAISSQASGNAASFDSQAFIDSQVASGQQNFADTVLPELRAFNSNIGGTAETNTVANLLSQQANARQGVSQAAIKANATAQASQIDANNLTVAGDAASRLSNSTIPLLDQLKGALAVGSSEQTQTGSQQQSGSQQSQGSSTDKGSSTSQQTQTTQELLTALSEALLSGTQQQDSITHAKGTTETTTTPSLFGALSQIVDLAGAFNK